MASKPKTDRQAAFLKAYSQNGNVTESARLAKCNRSQHYEWLADPDYADKFASAQEQAIEGLENIARRRAMSGSDVLLIFLLKAMRPATYRDNFKGEINISGAKGIDLSNLTDEQLHTLRTLAQAATEPGNDRGGAPPQSKE